MQTTGTLEEINIDYKTGKPKISFLINDKDKLSDIEQLKGLKLKIEAKKYIKREQLMLIIIFGNFCKKYVN